MTRLRPVVILVALAIPAATILRADDPGAGEATVTDVDGKETRLTTLKYSTGTKRLAWLANPAGTTEDEKKGPLAFELREPISTTHLEGIVTLIPVKSLEELRYDYEKREFSVRVKGLTQALTGELGYPRPINLFGIGGMAEGKSTSVTGGSAGKSAVKSIVFGGAGAPPAHKAGKLWNIQIAQPSADNPTLTARNLKVLYAFPGGINRVVDGMPIRKGTPFPFDENLKKYEQIAKDEVTNMATASVELGAAPERVIAIPLTLEKDKRVGTMLGILGEVEAGWKLFPLRTIKVITPSKRKIE